VYYLAPFLYGIGTGFLMSVLLGVIFFMLIQTGIKHGPKKGWAIAAGVVSGDIIFVFLAITFTAYISEFLKHHENKASFFGGIVLLIMGFTTFIKKRKNIEEDSKISKAKYTRDFFIKPFIVNFANPANAAWWIGLYSIPPAVNYFLDQKIIFAFGAISTVFFTEVGIAYGAAALKKFITPKILKRIDMVVGVALIFVALRLLSAAVGIF